MGWATNSRGIQTAIAEADVEMAPARRYVDLAVRFRVKDGPLAGSLTRPYGGVWDREIGGYHTIWKPGTGWVGGRTPKIHVIWVAAQSLEFIQDWVSRVVFALGGRRSGKTTGSLAPKLIVLMLCIPGKPGGVLSPTYRQSHNVWRALRRHTPRDWWAELRRSERLMILVNGSSVVLLSADRPGSSRSEGVAWVAWDERQDISEEAAANSMLSMSEGEGAAQIIETGTVKPELREHYDKLLANPLAKIYVMRSRGNPFITHDMFDLAESLLDRATIDRELEGRWPDLVGLVYYPFVREQHVIQWPLAGRTDVTVAYCAAHFDTPSFGPSRAEYLIGVDLPAHATICKMYEGDHLHAVDEVVIGADDRKGDVRELARLCKARCGGASAVVVIDPHDTHFDNDARKYFRQEGFRLTSLKRVLIEYRCTAVRARLERGLVSIDPRCVHLIEAMERQTYDPHQKPSKTMPSKITKYLTLDHPVDGFGYLVYKLWPAKVDYEALERAQRAA